MRIKSELYGLKQAPHAWYTRINNYFTGLGFTKSEADENLYQIVVDGKLLVIVLYVDDLILTGDEQLIHSCNDMKMGWMTCYDLQEPPTQLKKQKIYIALEFCRNVYLK